MTQPNPTPEEIALVRKACIAVGAEKDALIAASKIHDSLSAEELQQLLSLDLQSHPTLGSALTPLR